MSEAGVKMKMQFGNAAGSSVGGAESAFVDTPASIVDSLLSKLSGNKTAAPVLPPVSAQATPQASGLHIPKLYTTEATKLNTHSVVTAGTSVQGIREDIAARAQTAREGQAVVDALKGNGQAGGPGGQPGSANNAQGPSAATGGASPAATGMAGRTFGFVTNNWMGMAATAVVAAVVPAAAPAAAALSTLHSVGTYFAPAASGKNGRAIRQSEGYQAATSAPASEDIMRKLSQGPGFGPAPQPLLPAPGEEVYSRAMVAESSLEGIAGRINVDEYAKAVEQLDVDTKLAHDMMEHRLQHGVDDNPYKALAVDENAVNPHARQLLNPALV